MNAKFFRLYIMEIGYVRVSTNEQRVDLQIQALKLAGCDKIYTDKGISGKTDNRPGLQNALGALKKGDTLIVWRLDRLGRSLPSLIELVDSLGKDGVDFKSLTEGFDTTSISGKLVFHIMAALAEFERSLISERTKAGMSAAKKRGKKIGRPPTLSPMDIKNISAALDKDKTSVRKLANTYKVSVRTLQRSIVTHHKGQDRLHALQKTGT